jgi:hypothetical protein
VRGPSFTPIQNNLLTYLLTYSMVQDNIWKADSHSACKKILSLWNPEVLPCSQKPTIGPYPEHQVRGALKHLATIKIFKVRGC